jgi:hypothetical protein
VSNSANTTHKNAAVPVDEPLPGHVSEEFFRCGRARCRCRDGQRHGPYYVWVWWQDGQRRRRYIPRDQADQIRARCNQWRNERRSRRRAQVQWRQHLQELRPVLRQIEQPPI